MDPQNSRKANQSRSAGETLKAASTAAGDGAVPPRIGKFVVQKLLGRGAFGSVYLALDTDLSRPVAIKVPRAEGLTPALRDRFLREARATATIHHPNVCPVFEVGVQGDLPYIVMHYVPGGTLATYLDKQEALSPTVAVALAQKLALGVAAAHEKGVTHRDLKPQNVLFDPAKMLAVITDFGLAVMTSDPRTTVQGSVCGTPAYMSPEQARGKVNEIGPLSDVYSLGVILFRMLTGEVPFTGPVPVVVAAHVKAPPPVPSVVRPGLDTRLDAIVLKAMAKDPADRYPSAKALADALAEYASGGSRAATVAPTATATQPLPALPVTASRPAVKPPPLPPPRPAVPEPPAAPNVELVAGDPRKKWLLIGGGALVLLLTFLAGVFAPRLFRSSDRSPTSARSDAPAATPKAAAPKPVAAVTPTTPAPTVKPPDPKPPEPKAAPKLPDPNPVPDASKSAVKDGLAWLARQQKADGGWEFDAGTFKAERAAATGLALRPFIWAKAVRTERDDAQDRVITRGLDFLTAQSRAGKMTDSMYAQGIATIALCEGYGVTKDPLLKPVAQAAVDHLEKAQGPNGSWGYTAGTNGDTSIVGWQVQALHAAKAAGLSVSDQGLRNVSAFLNLTASGALKSAYGYSSNTGAQPGTALTAVGLLCRCHLDGWDATYPGLTDGVDGLSKNGSRGRGALRNLYYYFYATRVLRVYGGDAWKTWVEGAAAADGTRSGGMRDWLTTEQVTAGAGHGSWEPEAGFFGTSCGRLGTTAVAVAILQVCNGDR